MPFGYLITAGVISIYVLFAVRPPRPRRTAPFRVSFWLAAQVNEAPFLAFYVLLGSTALAIGQGDIENPSSDVALSVLATVGLACSSEPRGAAVPSTTCPGCAPRPAAFLSTDPVRAVPASPARPSGCGTRKLTSTKGQDAATRPLTALVAEPHAPRSDADATCTAGRS